jgi:hypothetical protein
MGREKKQNTKATPDSWEGEKRGQGGRAVMVRWVREEGRKPPEVETVGEFMCRRRKKRCEEKKAGATAMRGETAAASGGIGKAQSAALGRKRKELIKDLRGRTKKKKNENRSSDTGRGKSLADG